jgi:hypothetical protein
MSILKSFVYPASYSFVFSLHQRTRGREFKIRPEIRYQTFKKAFPSLLVGLIDVSSATPSRGLGKQEHFIASGYSMVQESEVAASWWPPDPLGLKGRPAEAIYCARVSS